MTNNEQQLGNDKIFSMIIKFSVPAIIATLVSSLYNMVDRIFIGKFVGEAALAGIVAAGPPMMFLFAFASLIGIGGSALISMNFGKKEYDYANNVFGNMISLGVIVTIIFMIVGLAFLEEILMLCGANGDVLVEAVIYFRVIVIGVVFQMISFISNCLVRTEAQPKIAMKATMSSALTNIILDFMFIAIFSMGSFGAALATVIAQAVGSFMSTSYFFKHKSTLKLKRENLHIKLKILKEISMIGSATFVSSIGISMSSAMFFSSLESYGGANALAAMGAINSINTLYTMPVNGIQQGLQPIIGYNHGAQNHARVKEALFKGLLLAYLFGILVYILIFTFPEAAMSLFIDASSSTMDIAVYGMRRYMFFMPILPTVVVSTAFFQSTGRSKIALFLGCSRQFVFLIPLILTLPRLFGLEGVWLVTPISDILSICCSLILMYKILKKY